MNTESKSISTAELKQAVQTIKTAILQSQGRAARMISGTQLSLYFGVGLYVSANSREGTWGDWSYFVSMRPSCINGTNIRYVMC